MVRFNLFLICPLAKIKDLDPKKNCLLFSYVAVLFKVLENGRFSWSVGSVKKYIYVGELSFDTLDDITSIHWVPSTCV